MTTTQVRMLVSISGTRDGADWPACGELATLPADEAVAMAAAGLVEVAAVDVEAAAGLAEVAAVEPGGDDVEQAADVAKPRARRGTSGGAA